MNFKRNVGCYWWLNSFQTMSCFQTRTDNSDGTMRVETTSTGVYLRRAHGIKKVKGRRRFSLCGWIRNGGFKYIFAVSSALIHFIHQFHVIMINYDCHCYWGSQNLERFLFPMQLCRYYLGLIYIWDLGLHGVMNKLYLRVNCHDCPASNWSLYKINNLTTIKKAWRAIVSSISNIN